MSFARSITAAIILSVIFCCFSAARIEAASRIDVRLIDTVAVPEDTGYISIYLTNRLDTVAGFEFTLAVDHPNLISFLPTFDSVGTRTSGWEYLSAQLTTTGIKLAGIANLIVPDQMVPGIPPSPASRLLIRFPYIAKVIADSATQRTAVISFLTTINQFGIASAAGQLIGIHQDTVYDTICYRCSSYVGDSCISYLPSAPPCDSVAIIISDFKTTIDTSQIHLYSGSVTLLPNCRPIPLPGDVDASGVVDSADLSFLRYYVQYGKVDLPAPQNADLDGDSCINWHDAAMLDTFLISGPGSVTFASCRKIAAVRCCCQGKRGNVNNDRFNVVDLLDLSLLVSFLTGGPTALPCAEGADCDGNGRIELADLSRMVAYLTTGAPAPSGCP